MLMSFVSVGVYVPAMIAPAVIESEATIAPLCPYIRASPAVVPAASPVILCEAIGMLAVIGVCPSLAMLRVRAVARSFIVLLNAVELIVVPVTTGLPGVYRE